MELLKTNFLHFKREFISLKFYIYPIIFVILSSYSLYLFLDLSTIETLGEEDSFFEYSTFFLFAFSSSIFFFLFIKSNNFFFLLLFIIFLFGAGEEITWGQRIFNFDTPNSISEINLQGEFNIHNLELFNSYDINDRSKTGIDKLFTIAFLYKLFWFSWCVLLPLFYFNFKFINNSALRIRVPIPAFSIGLFFLINWVAFKFSILLFSDNDETYRFYYVIGEIREFISSFIFFIIALFFLTKQEYLTGISNVNN